MIRWILKNWSHLDKRQKLLLRLVVKLIQILILKIDPLIIVRLIQQTKNLRHQDTIRCYKTKNKSMIDKPHTHNLSYRKKKMYFLSKWIKSTLIIRIKSLLEKCLNQKYNSIKTTPLQSRLFHTRTCAIEFKITSSPANKIIVYNNNEWIRINMIIS